MGHVPAVGAAQGRGGLLVWSSALTLMVLLAAAAALVPARGAMGAAVASLVAATAGVSVAIVGHHLFAGGAATLSGFVPRGGDFARIMQIPGALWRRLRRVHPA